ncbi:MAG: DHHA1 domain-containing protein [Nostoc sp.]
MESSVGRWLEVSPFKLINEAIAKSWGSGGGGKPNLAQAGGRDASKLPKALAQAQSELKSGLD